MPLYIYDLRRDWFVELYESIMGITGVKYEEEMFLITKTNNLWKVEQVVGPNDDLKYIGTTISKNLAIELIIAFCK